MLELRVGDSSRQDSGRLSAAVAPDLTCQLLDLRGSE